jgi:hypothetical protein
LTIYSIELFDLAQLVYKTNVPAHYQPPIYDSPKMAKPLATIAILSIGSMGAGVARLLVAHNYRVITNASDRRYVSM